MYTCHGKVNRMKAYIHTYMYQGQRTEGLSPGFDSKDMSFVVCNRLFCSEVEAPGEVLVVMRRFTIGASALRSASLLRTLASIACMGVDKVSGVTS